MKIVVLAKVVPDTYGERKLSLETGLADREASDLVLDEISERSIEVAVRHAEHSADTEVVLLVVAPESAAPTLRKGLALGAHNAIHVVDEGLIGADVVLTGEVIAAALRRTHFDVVIAGNLSTDGSSGMIPAAVAELLEVPHLTGLSSVELSESSVRGKRPVDGGTQTVSATLPAVVSITEALPDPRFPNFKSIMAAKKRPVETLALADLGVDPADATSARSIMLSVAERPPRAAGVKYVDEGDAAEKLLNFLSENRLV